jgi:hypothetical protein
MAGVTIDAVHDMPAILESLAKLSRWPTARIVFDADGSATDYADAVTQIGRVSGVMGEILDSAQVSTLSVDDYLRRTSEYLDTLGESVDLWEIGNEVNGDWLGETPDVVAKIGGAYRLVHARGKLTALTLYYNVGCASDSDHEVFAWASANVPAEMKAGIDYAFFSYYEDDCNHLEPDWPRSFPNSRRSFPRRS